MIQMKLSWGSGHNHILYCSNILKKIDIPTPGVLLLLLIAVTLLMWLELVMWLTLPMWLGLGMILVGLAAMLGVPLQTRSWSRSPSESRQRSGLLPTLRRHWLGLTLLVSADACFSNAASSSLSMLRLSSCSFSEDASFSLATHKQNKILEWD